MPPLQLLLRPKPMPPRQHRLLLMLSVQQKRKPQKRPQPPHKWRPRLPLQMLQKRLKMLPQPKPPLMRLPCKLLPTHKPQPTLPPRRLQLTLRPRRLQRMLPPQRQWCKRL